MTLVVAFALLGVFAAGIIYSTMAIIAFSDGREDGCLDTKYPGTAHPLAPDAIRRVYGSNAWVYQAGYDAGRRAPVK